MNHSFITNWFCL